MDKGAPRRKLQRKEVANMLRVVVESAKINPPLTPPPRPCVSIYFRGEHQDSGRKRGTPRGNTYSMRKIGLLVPYYVKGVLSDRKLRWTPSSSFITYHLYYHYFIILTFLLGHGYEKKRRLILFSNY